MEGGRVSDFFFKGSKSKIIFFCEDGGKGGEV